MWGIGLAAESLKEATRQNFGLHRLHDIIRIPIEIPDGPESSRAGAELQTCFQ